VAAHPMRAALAFAAAALASMTPALAAACPYCASQATSGNGQTIALGAFITLPFVVTGVILKVIRSERGALGAQNETSNQSSQSGSRRIAE
jgi:hypothetical protein